MNPNNAEEFRDTFIIKPISYDEILIKKVLVQ